MGIIEGNPEPVEEYRSEAESILRRLVSVRGQSAISLDAIEKITDAVFQEFFDQRIDPDLNASIAERLQKLLEAC